MSAKRSVRAGIVSVFCAFSTLSFLVGCNGGGGGSTTTTTPTAPTIAAVSVACAPASVQTGQTSQCTATVTGTGSFSTAVTWSVAGVQGGNSTAGTISTAGLYTGPAAMPSPNPVTVTATSTSDTTKSGSASITLTAASTITSVVAACTPSSVQTGQTSQCSATVTGTGSYASTVTWTASTGTIASTGLFTAPATAASATVTATSVQDTTKSGNATVTVTATASSGIAITTVPTSPTPLAVLHIGTTGINAGSPVTLTFSNSAGYSATEQAVRVASDGTVIAGVPIYINPSSGQIAEGTVSLVLSQGTQSTAATSITIQDLPPASTYGATLGQISHGFLIFESLLHSRRLNEFQAAQQIVGTKVDTTKAQTVMHDLTTGAAMARSDVDAIMANNGTTYSWGSLNGTKLQFDSTQLDVMDRILGAYLAQQFPSSSGAAATSDSSHADPLARPKSLSHPAFSATSTLNLLTCLASNKSACFMQAQEAVQSSSNPTDTGNALLTATQSTLMLGGAEQAAALPGIALGFTHLTASLGSLFHAAGDSAVCNASLDGCDAAAQDSIESELNSSGAGIVSSVAKSIAGIPAFLGLEAEAVTADLADQAIDSLTKVMGDGTEMAGADTTDVTLTSPTILPSLIGNMGYASGIAENGSSQNTTAPQSSLDLCCFGASKLGIDTLADPDGYYNLLVPIGVAGVNYTDLTLTEENPAASTTLGSETVNLSAISSTSDFTVPTLNPSSPTNPTPPTTPTAPPAPGSYTGSCSVQASSVTCCSNGDCATVPGTTASSPFGYTVPSGDTLSQFDSAVCGYVDTALSQAGCASWSCGYSASTSTSFTFSLSCTIPAVTGCTVETITETCTASN